MTNTNKIGKWERHGHDFVVSLRVGGRGAEMIGQTVPVRAKSGAQSFVRLTEVVEDFGTHDVVLFKGEKL